MHTQQVIAPKLLKEVFPHSILSNVLSAPRIEQQLSGVEMLADIDDSCRYYSNEDLLGVILNQLIDNAITFRHKDRSHKVFVSVNTNDDQMHIAVIDNGTGIPKKDHSGIFNIHQKQKEDARTGMGLFIVKSAAERLGGTIDLISIEGTVTQVTVCLPNVAPQHD